MEVFTYTPQVSFKTTPFVAIYGNLEEEFEKYKALEGCKFLGEGYTERGYKLFNDYGWVVALPFKKGFPLKVKVFKLPSADSFGKLDAVVGYPVEYWRITEKVTLIDGKKLKVWLYVAKKPEGEEIGKILYDAKVGIHYTEAV